MANPLKCDLCSKPATVHLTQIVNNKVHKVDLCETCAQAKGVTDPSGFSLADLLQTIEMTRKSGLLEIEPDSGRTGASGMIYFKDGVPLYSEYDKFEGDNAIFRMLPIKSGAYRFFPKDMPSVQKNVKRNVMSLLLEGARRSDEGRISGGVQAFTG